MCAMNAHTQTETQAGGHKPTVFAVLYMWKQQIIKNTVKQDESLVPH